MKKNPQWNPHALIICIAALIFFALGGLRARYVRNDFAPVFAGARCLLHGCNPYGSGELLYPPSTLLVLSPLALFKYPIAWFIWFVLSGVLFVAAVVVILSLCPKRQPWLATGLGAVFLAGSSLLLVLGQPSALAVSFVGIGVYFFLQGRRLLLGAMLIMFSLAVKPQIGGLIILYLFFRGVHRRYAALSMGGALAILLCGGLILSVHPQSADWVGGLRSNLSRAVVPGATDDPRPSNEQAAAALNLQTVTSVFFKDERVFNDVAYVIFGLLSAAWVVAVLRMIPNTNNHLLAIGALTVLTLMPIYHRNYDSRFLLLAIPGILIVFERRRVLGAFLYVLTASAIVSIQHWMQLFLQRDGMLKIVLGNKALLVLLLRESDIRLLILFSLYMVALFDSPDALSAKVTLRKPSVEHLGDPILNR
jgi:Glycosyltransferase family 87